MKIVMHCVYFPPEVGGLESHVYYLCRALAARGHDVSMVTSRSKPEAPAEEWMDGIHVRRSWFPSRSPIGWGLHAAASIPTLIEEAQGADIIHAQAFASVFPATRARRRTGAPLVTTFHTSHFLTRAERGIWRRYLSWCVRTSDYALAASEEIAAVAEGLAPGQVVEALTNGVETAFFRPVEPGIRRREGVHRIVVPRRLVPKNGVEYFVRAMPGIVERSSRPVEAIVVGDGPERGRLERLAKELGVADDLSFLGARPNPEMPGLLSSGDVAVLPSLMEATSVAALEAMACERPVAASRVGGLPEIVDESVGALFDPANPEDLAETVVALLEADDRLERGARARQRVVERWSNDRLADRHLEVYESLMNRR